MSDNLRDRIVAAIAAHEPVTDYDGADGECIECDLNPRWPDAPILPPSDGWKRHAEHLGDALIEALGLREEARDGAVVTDGFGTPIRIRPPRHRYVTEWTTDGVDPSP